MIHNREGGVIVYEGHSSPILSCIAILTAGDEYGYVILSTVRSQPLEEIKNEAYMEHDRLWMKENLGFITDEHQICVGITRSKYGLVITGKPCFI